MNSVLHGNPGHERETEHLEEARETLTVKAPSVGTIIKKMMALNPSLSAVDLIEIIRSSSMLKGGQAEDFAGVEVIDEAKALRLATAFKNQN